MIYNRRYILKDLKLDFINKKLINQLIDKKGCGMAVVKDQRMAQPVRAQIKGFVKAQGFI